MKPTGNFRAFATLVVCAISISCDPLPTPISATIRYGAEARLIDASTHLPIRKTLARLTVDRVEFQRRTNRDGKVSVPAGRHYYWTWLGGPMFANNPGANIRIDCEGYQPRTLKWPIMEGAENEAKRGVAELGDVPLQRR